VLNPLWSWLVHGEVPSRWSLAGGAIILCATAARTVWDASSSRTSADDWSRISAD
jgi:drug/metabolite transporter (DMT)-like permease